MHTGINDPQRQHLEETGWLRLPGLLSQAEVSQINDAISQVTTRFLTTGREKVLGLPLLRTVLPDGETIIGRLGYASHYVPQVRDLLHSQRFEAIRCLVSPTAVLAERCRMGTLFNDLRATPGGASSMGWHTDGHRLLFRGRWPVRNLQVCLHLDDAPPEHGGVRVLPGTHTQGLWGLLFRKLLFLDRRPDRDEFALSARAGDVTIYDGRLWHRTDPGDGSGARRRQLWLKYLETPEPDRTEESSASLFLRAQGLDG